MILLKENFSNKRIGEFKQFYKDNELVIYEVKQPYADGGGNTIWYEIFKYRVKEKDRFHDDEWEVYPNDEEFGTYAWACTTIGSVNKILKQRFPNHPITKGEIKLDFWV